MTSYFKRYYLDDVKLAQRALLEFYRSLHSGRMIAFTGSATTRGNGYGTWDELVEAYARIASEVVNKTASTPPGTIEPVDRLIRRKGFNHAGSIKSIMDYRKHMSRFDVRVCLGLMEEVVLSPENGKTRPLPDYVHDRNPFELDGVREPIDILSVELAKYFREPCRTEGLKTASQKFSAKYRRGDGRPSLDVVQALLRSLGVRRFATLNYDLEIERQAMLGGESATGGQETESPFDTMLRFLRTPGGALDWTLESGRIRRLLSNGQAIESDILNRERIDRMLEFAIGADDVDHHILHLHGRATDPTSMILSYRDYDKLYRSNDLYKLPFEFAQRIMIGGNPVVFVGLGMSEHEVNKALEDFVSSSPYQRIAPTFLFWNYHKPRHKMTDKDWSEVEMLRLDRFHRLGVLTIFDVDIDLYGKSDGLIGLATRVADKKQQGTETEAKARAREKAEAREEEIRWVAEVHNLHWLVEQAAPYAKRIALRENHVDAVRWRTMIPKISPGTGRPSILWKVIGGLSTNHEERAFHRCFDVLKDELRKQKNRCLCIVGSQGCGQGGMALQLAVRDAAQFCGDNFNLENTLLVNGSFAFDTDSILDGIVRFIDARRARDYMDVPEIEGAPDASPRPARSRGDYFRKLREKKDGAPLLIVIAGMSRFFSIQGHLLSAEMDELISFAADAKKPLNGITWLFLGTERLRNYMDAKQISTVPAERLGLTPFSAKDVLPSERLAAIRKAFADALDGIAPVEELDPARSRMLKDALDRYHALSAGRISGDSIPLSRAFYDLYLGHPFNAAMTGFGEQECGEPSKYMALEMGRELLRALAFIGVPTEACVLSHIPRIRKMAERECAQLSMSDLLERTLKKLVSLQLVIEIEGYCDKGKGNERRRYALPRTLLTELRYRFSVPLSEAKLSTAFNMSLYVAQPVDGFIPETDIHDELGQITDQLMGAYRDQAANENKSFDGAHLDALRRVADMVSFHERPVVSSKAGKATLLKRQAQQIDALCRPDHAERLRAALALIRGYYTTTDLLTLDVGDRLIREDRDGILLEHAERLDTLIDAYGKVAIARAGLRKEMQAMGEEQGSKLWSDIYTDVEPFYPDEMVWLHNERGVVRLVMGDLDEAAASFERAFDINQRHVERRDRSHNWRRIRLNQLTLDIERGEIGLALRRINEVLSVSQSKPAADQDGAEKPQESPSPDLARTKKAEEQNRSKMSREDELAEAIARGYRGRAHHLQGDSQGAHYDYNFAIAKLQQLDEQRAQAYFLRMRAELGGERRTQDLQSALHLANATRQMDIVYRLRIMLALDELSLNTDHKAEAVDRPRAHRMLDEAVRYALQTDMHRVRVEAGAALAEARLDSGDYEGALRNISDGLMVATRFGMELSKIHLRSLMARIMARRGHPITASKLAMTTIRIASRRKFQLAIEHAEETLLTIPRVSAITKIIDASSRRQL